VRIFKDLKWKGLIYKGTDYSDRFLVSNYGDIYSLKTNRILKKHINKNGYYQICVSLGAKDKKIIIKPHMAVAFNFVGGYEEGLVVNHKDCNKLRNYYMNLEWITSKENTVHGIENGCRKSLKKVRCIETGEIFKSIADATEWAGLRRRSDSIRKSIKHIINHAGRHPTTGQRLTWEYIE